MKKKVLLLCALMAILLNFNTTITNAYKVESTTDVGIMSEDAVWKFQTINGRLHRRLWSESKSIWLSNWIPV